MKTEALFAYAGRCQHSGRAYGKKAVQRVDALADYILAHPDIFYTVVFAAGKKTRFASAKVFMNRHLLLRLESARKNGKEFVSPEIVLLENPECSIGSEIRLLKEFVAKRNIERCGIVYSLRHTVEVLISITRDISYPAFYGIPAWAPSWVMKLMARFGEDQPPPEPDQQLALESN